MSAGAGSDGSAAGVRGAKRTNTGVGQPASMAVGNIAASIVEKFVEPAAEVQKAHAEAARLSQALKAPGMPVMIHGHRAADPEPGGTITISGSTPNMPQGADLLQLFVNSHHSSYSSQNELHGTVVGVMQGGRVVDGPILVVRTDAGSNATTSNKVIAIAGWRPTTTL